eukprot:4649815-Pyramimonas_sp.AAC.1
MISLASGPRGAGPDILSADWLVMALPISSRSARPAGDLPSIAHSKWPAHAEDPHDEPQLWQRDRPEVRHGLDHDRLHLLVFPLREQRDGGDHESHENVQVWAASALPVLGLALILSLLHVLAGVVVLLARANAGLHERIGGWEDGALVDRRLQLCDVPLERDEEARHE